MLSLEGIIAICAIVIILLVGWIRKNSACFTLILANIAVFIITLFYPGLLVELGFSPLYLRAAPGRAFLTLFTSMFVHGGFSHLIMNMLIFFLLGFSFEQRIGRAKFLLVYFISGLIGTVCFALLNLGTSTLVVGASGAIFGILGAYAISYPKDRIILPVGFIFMRIPVYIGALFMALIETVYAASGVTTGISHISHLGGFMGGAAFMPLLRSTRITEEKVGSKIDFQALRELAKTDRDQELINLLEQEKFPEVFDSWLKYLLARLECPRCGSKLEGKGDKIQCRCGFEEKYKK
jgi:membrane associated rhomboid family serine protease